MRILVATPWFSPHTGYIENGLPSALAALGHEVLLVTSALQPGFTSPHYDSVYAPFMGAAMQPLGETTVGAVRLLRLPYVAYGTHIALRGLARVLAAFRPQVVQTFSVNTPLTLQLAGLQRSHRFRLFLGAHLPAVASQNGSSLLARGPLQKAVQLFTRWIPGRFAANRAELCYAVTDDCARVAHEVNGVPHAKIRRASLGVDTCVYYPLADPLERSSTRQQYGLNDDDIVCVYSGRFDDVKNPLLLGEAVRLLRDEGRSVRCLFIGGGPQEAALRALGGSVVLPLMSQGSLSVHFRAADIAVWPFHYSSSQLDALACGLPLVMSDAINDPTRVAGCGAVFRHGDAEDLARVIARLCDQATRISLGSCGAQRVRESLSWHGLAQGRCADYVASLSRADTAVDKRRSILVRDS